jgi:hypothetical protein
MERSTKKSARITDAWEDNESGDVACTAQELERVGLTIRLDRWNLGAGLRLWDLIETFIRDEHLSDAWILYATQASLGSEPCREEYTYALNRALRTRGARFPVIGHRERSRSR